ncbi:MAG: DNA internalization-related competence protein ComEC/Rec2 [Lachnospiraceae bacterium]|nr:DNA internalization-related competence protein ComEC/Rec2 [Lachnospiraceae bacterium]
MEQRPMVWMFLATIVGVLLWKQWIVGGMITTALFLVFYHFHKKKETYAITLVLMALGMALGLMSSANYHQRYYNIQKEARVAANHGQKLQTGGTVLQVKESETSIQYKIKSKKKFFIQVFQSKKQTKQFYQVGDKVMIIGSPTSFSHAKNEGGYDEVAVSHGEGVVLKFLSPYMKKMGANPFYAFLSKVRLHYQSSYSGLSKNGEAILNAMCLGDKSLLSDTLKDDFQRAGMSHILAISGVHVSVVGMALFGWLLKRKLYLSQCALGAFFGVSFFVLFSGNGQSAMRAGIMFFIYLGSILLGSSYDGLTSTAFAGILIALCYPYAIYSAAFQYSFVAVGSVFLAMELCIHLYEKIHPLRKTLLISFFIYSSNFILMAFYQYEVPLFSIMINFLVLPLVSPILALGLLGGGLNFAFLLTLCDGFISFMYLVARFFAKIPRATVVVGKPSPVLCILYMAIWLLAYVLAYQKKKLRFLLIIFLPMILIILSHQHHNDDLTFLDVGQGDGIYVETDSGRSYMVDGGSSSEKQIGRYVLEPFLKSRGRGRIHLWFVSHCDKDHISGLQELLENHFPIDAICFTRNVVKSEGYKSIITLAKANHTKIFHVKNGTLISEKSLSINTFSCPGTDANDASLVLLLHFIKSEKTALLGGDISSEVEEKFLPSIKESLQGSFISIMKANHHGSKFSNGMETLSELNPSLFIISAGRNNSYGHPSPEVLERLDKLKIKHWCTKDVGEIRVDVK